MFYQDELLVGEGIPPSGPVERAEATNPAEATMTFLNCILKTCSDRIEDVE